ncbi:MAG: BON domain-containing protein [Candidatus Sulfomarinibacteraceae bacterium]
MRNTGHRTFESATRACSALLVLLVLSHPGSAFGATDEVTDLGISDAVEDRLLSDPAVPLNRIGVSVENGVVELDGTVTNVTAKQRAVELATVIRGVRSIIDRIRVVPVWDVSDEELEADVREALFRDPATEEWEVEINVADASVDLTGVVDSWSEKRLAERIAGSVRGVREVDNGIAVEIVENRGDSELEMEIEAMLRWDAYLSRSVIRTRVEDGAAVLTGSVCSLGQRVLAANNAWVAGVRSVDVSGLEIIDCAAGTIETRRLSTPPPSDEEIAAAVHAAFTIDPRIGTTEIRVGVDQGEVTLRGRVSNLRERSAAAEDARNTTGVTGVVNRLQLRSELFLPEILLPDPELALLVSGALDRDPYVERFDIGVATLGGTVYLTGTVDTEFDRARAEKLAATIVGVMEIKNHLRVLDPLAIRSDGRPLGEFPHNGQPWYRPLWEASPRTDASIRRSIESRLWWSAEIDSDNVAVRVDDGVATLVGTVGSWRERDAATHAAYSGGATSVRNRLDVDFPVMGSKP